ncbi:hypothetical protein CEXT_119181 [Caerostris extrusa]|uniref:Uncharacterized protein n=1 Tax=Caerostris extrusa TaxID=172846 RepID=A0AAV4TP19_CAEEX|nr:hypothetical protein CEXT_119181 [Caerostris extrusa]
MGHSCVYSCCLVNKQNLAEEQDTRRDGRPLRVIEFCFRERGCRNEKSAVHESNERNNKVLQRYYIKLIRSLLNAIEKD